MLYGWVRQENREMDRHIERSLREKLQGQSDTTIFSLGAGKIPHAGSSSVGSLISEEKELSIIKLPAN